MPALPSLRVCSVALALVSMLAACGDDGGDESGAATTSSTSESPTSTTDADTGSTSAATTEDASTTASVDDTTATAATDATDDTTTGPTGDPTYPPIDGGQCPQGTLPVMLPGAQLCAPFCGGPDDACPPAATGAASPVCTPFAGQGGSGAACDDATPCPDGETCSEGTCAEVAFYACQLACGMGEACPDEMACSGIGTCGYP